MTDVFDDTPPESLLRQTAWLDALARELVDDPHRAQDAVQDAWVMALRHRAQVRRLGPWLGQVVRHLASRQRDREAGRARREARCAQPESQPSALEVVVRVQQQHRVVAAVLALDEPYRATVLMRFFDGLPPRAIAERTGVPVATVRTRLGRALVRLRAVLDDENGGRRAWAAPLLSGLAMPGAAAGSITGVLMKIQLTSAAAVAAALGLLATLWFALPIGRPDAATPPPEIEVPARAAAVDAATQVPDAGAGEDAAERTTIGAPAPAAVPAPDALEPLSGTVVDADGRPVAGARVVIVEPLGAGFSLLAGSREVEERGERTTGADGRFALPVPFARLHGLHVSKAGFAARQVEPCYGGEDHTVVLQPGAALLGRITDAATGDPVPGVALSGFYEANRTERVAGVSSADGTFALRDLPSGVLKVDVMPVHYEAQLRHDVVLRAGETARLDVALERGGIVFGTVTDAESGLPVPAAEVSAGWTFAKVVRTDAAGNYRMGGAPGPGVPDMHVRAGGYAQTSKEVGGKGEQRVDFALQRGGSVRGRIVHAGGAPAAGVYVAADADLGVENGMGRTDWRHVRSGADGMFRITGLVPGAHYALIVRHRGAATLTYLLPGAVEAHRDVDVGEVVLPPPAVLLGRVVDPAGIGVPDASVDLSGTNADFDALLGPGERETRPVPYHASSRDARTDRHGWFRMADLAGGTYDVVVRVPGGPRAELDDVRVEPGRTTADVEIVVDLGLELAGTVTTDDGTPLPAHVSVRVEQQERQDGSARMERWVLVGRDGSFRARGLAEGLYRLEVTVSRWANDAPPPWIGSETDDVRAGRSDLRLVLRRAADIAGRVVDSDGRTRQGISVVAVRDGAPDEDVRTRTGDDGGFLLRVLPGTVWTLRYGEAPPSQSGLVLPPRDGSTREYAGARAGTTDLVLELR